MTKLTPLHSLPRRHFVYFLRQVVNPLAPQRNFVGDWDLKRVIAFKASLEAPADGNLEALAEKVFHLTNAPEECLSEADQELVKGYKGPSLSVGDVVVVNDNGVHHRFLCLPCGWERR